MRVHTPTHREGETRDDYDNRLAASSRLCLEQAERERVEQRKLCKQKQLRVEAESLLLKVKEAKKKHHRQKHGNDKGRHESTQVRNDMHPGDQEMRRREHYREWLATQNVLKSMRQADICDSRQSNIPACDK